MQANEALQCITTPELMLPIIDDVIHHLQAQIKEGENLIKNRPIHKKAYDKWEGATCRILEKSASFDPTLVSRFLKCGSYGSFKKKSNEAFWENHRAMSIYDKIRIVEYHLSELKKIKHKPELILDNA